MANNCLRSICSSHKSFDGYNNTHQMKYINRTKNRMQYSRYYPISNTSALYKRYTHTHCTYYYLVYYVSKSSAGRRFCRLK